MAVQGGPTYNLSQQPWAQPGESAPISLTPSVSAGETAAHPLKRRPPHHNTHQKKKKKERKCSDRSCGIPGFNVSMSLNLCVSLVFPVKLAKIHDLVMDTYRVIKSKLPGTLQSMSLYLANRDTEFILFKPVRVGGHDSSFLLSSHSPCHSPLAASGLVRVEVPAFTV